MIPVWVLSLVAAVVIGLTTGAGEYLTWAGVALAGAVIVTFAIQLALQVKEGFVVRAMVSIGGAIIILAIATGLFALVG
ncbi:hypothetical protein BH10ACT7_BH10ACT7_16960 [soil metagenome]